MKILYFGGQKSGKSAMAETKALELATQKPIYIATYNNNFGDTEMEQRVTKHQANREAKFITIEEPKDLTKVIKEGGTYLVDCLSMWLLNNITLDENELLAQLNIIKNLNANIIFVLNDVSSGVIPLDNLSRKYVDMSGIIGQFVARFCDEVYEVKMGIEIKIK